LLKLWTAVYHTIVSVSWGSCPLGKPTIKRTACKS